MTQQRPKERPTNAPAEPGFIRKREWAGLCRSPRNPSDRPVAMSYTRRSLASREVDMPSYKSKAWVVDSEPDGLYTANVLELPAHSNGLRSPKPRLSHGLRTGGAVM